MSNMTEKLTTAGHAGMEAAKNMGRKIAEGAERAVGYVKERAGMHHSTSPDARAQGIREHMDVIASCGKKVGEVDRLEGPAIKLTKSSSPDGNHHYIPVAWVERVDSHVHLSKNSRETESEWQDSAASCTCH